MDGFMKNALGTVTIKAISKKLGVSSVSVHRALKGKEGISDELRARILETSREMGYVENYAAASIKRKTERVAVVIPQDKWEKKIYFDYKLNLSNIKSTFDIKLILLLEQVYRCFKINNGEVYHK